MICQSCRTSLFSHIKHSSSSPYLRLLTNSSRPYSGTPSFLSSTPAPSSPSIALPSTGASPPPPPQQAADDASKASGGKVLSSCTVGTRLQGLNYMKNKPDLVALDDSEYPSWLWGILEDGKGGSGKGNAEGAEGEIRKLYTLCSSPFYPDFHLCSLLSFRILITNPHKNRNEPQTTKTSREESRRRRSRKATQDPRPRAGYRCPTSLCCFQPQRCCNGSE